MTRFAFKILTIAICFASLPTLCAETVVTTYVTKTQEDRESTRFTLTEWLHIKERMKMMDVWLAMFSDPKQDKFCPELDLGYFVQRGTLVTTNEAAASETGDFNAAMARGQLWLTNIFTGSTGLKLVNIDFGLEAGQRVSDAYTPQAAVNAQANRKLKSEFYTANFRLFGKNIQDSSIVFKIGTYHTSQGTALLQGNPEAPSVEGRALGGELQLYLFKWLGAEMDYLSFQPKTFGVSSNTINGTYYEYSAYIEISLLRLVMGKYHEEWHFATLAGNASTSDDGLFGGLKLQF